jgi:hypothetical protein
MKKSGLMRSSVLALAFAAILTGCSSNPFTPPIDDGGGGLPPDTPLNDTPQNTMLRFEATYENQIIAEYEKLFASNFRFTFSSQTDDSLVQRYGTIHVDAPVDPGGVRACRNGNVHVARDGGVRGRS